jgi:hypothetical protein
MAARAHLDLPDGRSFNFVRKYPAEAFSAGLMYFGRARGVDGGRAQPHTSDGDTI